MREEMAIAEAQKRRDLMDAEEAHELLQATDEHFHSMLAGEDTEISLPMIE